MTREDSGGGPVPPRPHFDPALGDGWVEIGDGRRFWGRFGAAGLLLRDPAGRVLLQHRVSWSHFGDTWGSRAVPGTRRRPPSRRRCASRRRRQGSRPGWCSRCCPAS
ncbi:hypothetical protein [Rathayibacter oskolensis]|uniref:hypothetical protein n=1 Tax=Rathayibacter oskolensis TaxID=1891671 RepID=UPI003466CB39